jgi:hypothetical protein
VSGSLCRARVETLVIGKLTFARWAVVGGIVAAVGVAGAATKLKKPAAGDACLCTPDAQAPNDLTAAIDPTAAPSYASRGVTVPAGSNSTAGPLTAALPGSVAEYHGGAGSAAGNSGNGVGFGAGGRFVGARSASNSGHSATLGGLWRLMSLSRRASPHEAAAIRAAKAPKAAKTPKGPQGPKESHSGRPGSGPSTPGSGPSTTAPVNSDLFAEQTTTIPDLLAGGGAPLLGNPGSSKVGGAGGAGGDAGSLAATPEPGPLFFVGAGLLAIASLLRRRLTAAA